ncbi:MAG: hypothetical protein IT449_02795 [Phycisphaerales bacterium]|nr:hypothetical protein [Phycisphaerales bacterium]
MKKNIALRVLFGCAVLTGTSFASETVGTIVTYQGRLTEGGQPASGAHDFKVFLFDALTGGAQIATVTKSNVTVTNGLFTLDLDFGQVYGEVALFVELRVSPAGLNQFETLTPRQRLTPTPFALKVPGIDGHSLNAADGSPTDALFVDPNGNVGIGTTAPTSKLHVTGGSIVAENIGDQADLLWLASERSWVFRQQGTGAAAALKLQNVGGGGNKNFLIETTGNVGIGTLAPTHTMHIANAAPTIALQDTDSTTQQVGYVSYRDSANAERAWVGYGSPGDPDFSIVNARPDGDIVLAAFGAGADIVLSPAAGGVVSVPVLEITGADLAEKFPTSDAVEPGMVVAIDPANPGKLCLARGAYNHCVAGIVSGANNFPVGAVLGSAAGHEDAPAIALSGRVYVWCDAGADAIKPGDLLTTSDTPGYAMKASDAARSHGAVLGKAMTALVAGEKGLVLVLVNLQ